ncbi:hypothetical protein HY477_02240 [Candidatus Uhrbacteria bacterium]|nr:hypothetical protein [Candidatus Uhrbacteria bacterium]
MSERMNKRVMEYVITHGSSSPKPLHYLGFFVFLKMIQHLLSPGFVYSLAIFLALAGVASAAIESRNALPGQTLYGAKLAVDEVKVRFTSNPAARAQVQMEIAGHRLREIQEISQTGEEYNGRLNEALTRFTRDVGEAKKNLAQAGDPVQVKAVATEIAKKAEKYKQELTATQALIEQKVASSQPDRDASEEDAISSNTTGEIEEIEMDVALSKKPVRAVEFSAFVQAQEALDSVSQDQQVEEIVENSEDDANAEEKVEELEEGEVGL